MTFAFQEISLALKQLWDRNAQYRPLTRNAIKGQKGESALYISSNFYKKRFEIRHFLIFFSNIRVETIQIFQRPEKSGVEMMEHMSGMRLFTFETDFHRNLMLLWVKTSRPEQNGHCFADNIFQQILTTQTIYICNIIWHKFISKVPIDNTSSLVQAMAGTKLMTSHSLNQWWQEFCHHILSPYWESLDLNK